MRKYLYIILSLLIIQSLRAETIDTVKSALNSMEYDMQVALHQYRYTDNAAGMYLSQVDNVSNTYLQYRIENGNHYRIQEGNGKRDFQFRTERYDKLSKYIYMNGSFSFNYNQKLGTKMSDVINTYNSNPFIYGSSIEKDFQMQDFHLNFRLYTVPISDVVSFGMIVDYEVTDYSGDRDPRPRTQYMHANVSPSLLFKLNSNNSIGFNGKYRYEKEKLLGLTTIQSYPNLEYYDFKGLEHYESKIGGYTGFKRQFISHGGGGALQYSYNSENVNVLLNAGYQYDGLTVLEDKKRNPGTYTSERLITSAQVNFGKSYKHHFHLAFEGLIGSSNENIQELETSRDPITEIVTETWKTIYTYENRYFVETLSAQLDWRMFKLNKEKKPVWGLDAEVGFEKFENRYHLPDSRYGASKILAGVGASGQFYSKRYHSIDARLGVNGSYTLNTTLDVSEINYVVKEVFVPDLIYHQRSYIDPELTIRYEFPISLSKRQMQMFGYVRLDASYLAALGGTHWWSAMLTLGILTL